MKTTFFFVEEYKYYMFNQRFEERAIIALIALHLKYATNFYIYYFTAFNGEIAFKKYNS